MRGARYHGAKVRGAAACALRRPAGAVRDAVWRSTRARCARREHAAGAGAGRRGLRGARRGVHRGGRRCAAAQLRSHRVRRALRRHERGARLQRRVLRECVPAAARRRAGPQGAGGVWRRRDLGALRAADGRVAHRMAPGADPRRPTGAPAHAGYTQSIYETLRAIASCF